MTPIDISRDIQGKHIRFTRSLDTGIERVFIDGVKVSSKLNWLGLTEHELSIDNHQLVIKYDSQLTDNHFSVHWCLDNQPLPADHWSLEDTGKVKLTEDDKQFVGDWRIKNSSFLLVFLPYFLMIVANFVMNLTGTHEIAKPYFIGLFGLTGILGLAAIIFMWIVSFIKKPPEVNLD